MLQRLSSIYFLEIHYLICATIFLPNIFSHWMRYIWEKLEANITNLCNLHMWAHYSDIQRPCHHRRDTIPQIHFAEAHRSTTVPTVCESKHYCYHVSLNENHQRLPSMQAISISWRDINYKFIDIKEDKNPVWKLRLTTSDELEHRDNQ